MLPPSVLRQLFVPRCPKKPKCWNDPLFGGDERQRETAIKGQNAKCYLRFRNWDGVSAFRSGVSTGWDTPETQLAEIHRLPLKEKALFESHY
jgi:hypothetical protein